MWDRQFLHSYEIENRLVMMVHTHPALGQQIMPPFYDPLGRFAARLYPA